MLNQRLPYSYFFWIALSVIVSIVFINSLSIVDGVLTSILSTCFLYVTIAKYACKVDILDNTIYINYLFPLFFLKRKIELKRGTLLEFELGYFYYFDDEHNLAPIQFLYPHDRITLYEIVDGKKTKYDGLNIHVSYSGLKKIRKTLEENSNVLVSDKL